MYYIGLRNNEDKVVFLQSYFKSGINYNHQALILFFYIETSLLIAIY